MKLKEHFEVALSQRQVANQGASRGLPRGNLGGGIRGAKKASGARLSEDELGKLKELCRLQVSGLNESGPDSALDTLGWMMVIMMMTDVLLVLSRWMSWKP